MSIKDSVVFPSNKAGESKIKIGIVFPCYGYERVSYSLPISEVEFTRSRTVPIHRILKSNFYKNTPIIIPTKTDYLHTWNALPISTSPFFISFENEIPRYFGSVSNWQESLGFSILKSSRCRGILALSDVAAKLAIEKMNEYGYPEIASKISVFRGGVAIDKSLFMLPKVPSQVLKIIFVGGDIFPKGFVPAFEALQDLVKKGVKIELVVIGKFKEGSYVLKEYSPDINKWNDTLQNASWVTHYTELPNSVVLAKMATHDLLISPSYDETLGWAIIEAGLLGVPAITTNVFALPELVKHNESGYVINLKLGKQNRWLGIWASNTELKLELAEANKLIYDGITNAVKQVIKQPEILEKWSNNCKNHLSKLYDVNIAASKLLDIYKKG